MVMYKTIRVWCDLLLMATSSIVHSLFNFSVLDFFFALITDYPLHIARSLLLVEIELLFLLCSLHLTTIRILQIALNNVVPILPYSPQTRLLHDRRDDSPTQRVIADD